MRHSLLDHRSTAAAGAHRAARPHERGLSLVEVTIVLTVLASLVAALTPTIANYVDHARQARARQDVQVIGEAIRLFVEDNAEGQFLIDASNGAGDQTPPTRADANRVNLLVSDGDVPTRASAISGETYWTQPLDSAVTTVDTLSNHLIENTPGGSTTKRYRTPSDITLSSPTGNNNIDFARSESSGFNAPYAWRGAYLRARIGPDPWGNRYAANVVFLDPTVTAAISGVTSPFDTTFLPYPRLDVFVLSAGPDQEIDTASAQDGVVPGDNDIIFVVTGNAK